MDKNHVQQQAKDWPKSGEKYIYYKGGEYEVVSSGMMETTLKPYVVYRSLKYGTVWIRPLANFNARVNVGGKRVNRFTIVSVSANNQQEEE